MEKSETMKKYLADKLKKKQGTEDAQANPVNVAGVCFPSVPPTQSMLVHMHTGVYVQLLDTATAHAH